MYHIIFDMGKMKKNIYLVYLTFKNESNTLIYVIYVLEMSLSYFFRHKAYFVLQLFPLLLRRQWKLNYLLNCLISVLIWRKISHRKCFDQRFEIIDQKWESYHSCLTWQRSLLGNFYNSLPKYKHITWSLAVTKTEI